MASFTSLDWIGVVVAACSVTALLLFHLWVGHAFAELYREFNARDALPLLARLSVSWWFPPLLGLGPLGALSAGVLLGPPTSIGHRRAWIVAAFVLAVVGFSVCLVGVYLPLFDLAEIKGDDPM